MSEQANSPEKDQPKPQGGKGKGNKSFKSHADSPPKDIVSEKKLEEFGLKYYDKYKLEKDRNLITGLGQKVKQYIKLSPVDADRFNEQQNNSNFFLKEHGEKYVLAVTRTAPDTESGGKKVMEQIYVRESVAKQQKLSIVESE